LLFSERKNNDVVFFVLIIFLVKLIFYYSDKAAFKPIPTFLAHSRWDAASAE
jgi:hypothetical protein